ncbi:MAG: tripartite tricarboxylate transporter substrate binding protein [Desulfobacterales bacterium]|nr:tripartite tricarboxylate transporter substrate binding protein [Desulfobacterales bacterium]
MKKTSLLVVGFVLVVSLFFGASFLQAQTYPHYPIQFIITLAPGDGLDVTGRAIAEQLGKILETPVVPMNKPGGGGTMGVDYVVKGKKDGYTILYSNSSLIYTYALNPEIVPYNPFQDLEPLCLSGSVPLLIAVQAESPWKSFPELIDYMKKNPGKVRGSSSGIGSIGHFCYEVIRMETGAGITMIPYKGAMPGFTALLGGHVEVAVPSLTIVSPHLASGKVRVLLTSKKIPEHPNIPTLTELGYKRDMPSVWNAAFVPTGVADSVKKILHSAFEKSIKTPDVANIMQKIGYVQDYKPGEEFKKSMLEEYVIIKEISKTVGPIAK